MNLGTDILPDGTLTRRTFCSKRIETVTKVNADGDTIVRNVTRTTSNMHDYMGSFWTVRGETAAKRVLTPTGYVDLTTGKHYWYLTNRQGSTMAVVDETGAVVQRNGYYPSGTPYVLPSEIGTTPAPSMTAVTDQLHIGNRWLSHAGLNLYDNTARFHDPLLMRFTAPDPLAADFPGLSPWSHCAGNSINLIDPSGKDIVILNYGNDPAHQHLAMLIQNQKGKWQYYSVNGNNVYISGKFSGGRPFNDVARSSWNSPQEFLDSSYNERTENSQADKENKNHFGFKEGYQIHTTPEQDAIMRDEFKNVANTQYSILGNNCATAVQSVMLKAGIPVAKTQYKKIHIPSNIYLGEPSHDIIKLNIEPIPSSAFKSIMEVNPDGIYLQKSE